MCNATLITPHRPLLFLLLHRPLCLLLRPHVANINILQARNQRLKHLTYTLHLPLSSHVLLLSTMTSPHLDGEASPIVTLLTLLQT